MGNKKKKELYEMDNDELFSIAADCLAVIFERSHKIQDFYTVENDLMTINISIGYNKNGWPATLYKQ